MIKNLKYICLALAGMLAVSCSKDDDVPVVKHDFVPIAFAGDLKTEETVTRADGEEVSLTEYSKQFVVTGYKTTPTDGLKDVMTNYNVNWVENTAGSTVTNTADWEYVGQGADQDIKYWDFAATNYRFQAYVPQRAEAKSGYALYEYSTSSAKRSGENWVDITFSNLTHIAVKSDGYYVGTDKVSQYDLPLYSEFWSKSSIDMWNETTDMASPVKLVFRSPFARVRLMFKRSANSTSPAESCYLENIEFTPITTDGSSPSKVVLDGSVKVSYPLNESAGNALVVTGISDGTTSEADKLEFDDMLELDGTTKKGILEITEHPYTAYPEYLLLPRLGKNNPFKLSLSVGGIEQSCEIPAELVEWKPGYEYTYIFKILESGGVRLDLIDVGISGWTNEGPYPHDVYNW